MRNVPRQLLRRTAVSVVAAGMLTAGLPAPALAADGWGVNHGAGVNAPKYTNTTVKWEYKCIASGAAVFKPTKAKIVMWSNGARIKGFNFKYRIVAADTDGQPAYYSNWSDNASLDFKKNANKSQWMTAMAGSNGQSWSSAAQWDIEIKLKYERSLRTAYHYKYRRPLVTPQCGVLSRVGHGNRFDSPHHAWVS